MTATDRAACGRPDGEAPAWMDAFVAGPFARNGAFARFDGFERMVRVSQEHLAFVSRRLDRDREVAARLASASSPVDLPAIWGEFFETARREYAEEAPRLLSCWLQPAAEAQAGARGKRPAMKAAPNAAAAG